jgi:hypothetical protein
MTAKGNKKMQRNSTAFVPNFISAVLLIAHKNISVFDKMIF